MTILVARIETKDGKGICAATGSPFCSIYRMTGGKEIEHCAFSHACWQKFDQAETDGHSKPCFAFPSLGALENWFPLAEGRKAMQDHGACCHVYRVDDLIAKSPFQCVFDKNKATLIGEIDLNTLRLTDYPA